MLRSKTFKTQHMGRVCPPPLLSQSCLSLAARKHRYDGDFFCTLKIVFDPLPSHKGGVFDISHAITNFVTPVFAVL